MAEGGLVEGLLGGEGEEREAEIGIAGPDAIAATVAMDAARYDPELARQAGEYLARQSRLVDLQLHHFDEERRLAIEAARRKRFADRIRNGLLAGTALVVLGVAVAVAKVAWDAVNARDVVVEALSTPPDLAAQGLTGRVLASRLQDRLNALQADTVSAEESARASGESEGGLKVEILETGISLAELQQSLRQWLGHETRVSGEIIHTTDAAGAPALALTVRVGEKPGEQSTGQVAGIDRLVQSAAEKVYAGVSPARFADWLVEKGRDSDAVALFKRLAEHGPTAQRVLADASLGSSRLGLLPFDQRQPYLREAARLSPNDYEVQLGLASAEAYMGHDEAVLRIDKALLKMAAPANLSVAGREIRKHQRQFAVDNLLGDYRDALVVSDEDAVNAATDPGEWSRQSATMLDRVYFHDLPPVRDYVRNGYVNDPAISPASNARRETAKLAVVDRLDMASGAWNGVIARADHLAELAKLDTEAVAPWTLAIRHAYALARSGRQAEAEALIATTPLDCYRCVETRAEIAEIKADRAAADRWFAEAVRQGPSLPLAESEWGDALAARGQLDQAVALYSASHAKGPKFADPLKGWGDVLARQGQWKAALAKYDEALKDAPAWVALHQARDTAAKHAV